MKSFLYGAMWAFICQIVCWLLFIVCDEVWIISKSSSETLALIVGIITLIMVLVFYFVKANKYIKKKELNSLVFNIGLLLIWCASSFLTMIGLLKLVENDLLHVCSGSGWSCFLNGIEYGIEGYFMLALAVIIVVINLIIKCIKFFIGKKEQ